MNGAICGEQTQMLCFCSPIEYPTRIVASQRLHKQRNTGGIYPARYGCREYQNRCRLEFCRTIHFKHFRNPQYLSLPRRIKANNALDSVARTIDTFCLRISGNVIIQPAVAYTRFISRRFGKQHALIFR